MKESKKMTSGHLYHAVGYARTASNTKKTISHIKLYQGYIYPEKMPLF